MSNSGWRPHIESALRLDIRRLVRLGLLRDGARGSLHWKGEDESTDRASTGYTVTFHGEGGMLTLSYSTTDHDTGERKNSTCTIRLSSIPLRFGGRRWYMHCPYTQRRAQTLHKWHGIEMFCHRTAIRPRPTYASQRVSGCDRIIAQRWAIRRKLGDRYSDLFGEPFKPSRMRWHTFQRYAHRDAELAEMENAYLLRRIGPFTQWI